MNKTLFTLCFAALLAAGPSFAQTTPVFFSWDQSDPDTSTGSGTIFAVVEGVFFQADMPIPFLTQADSLFSGPPLETFVTTGPGGEGVVGFVNGPDDSTQPGPQGGGFHLGWGGQTVNLIGNKGGIEFTFPVQLFWGDADDNNNRYSGSWVAFDTGDPNSAYDVTNGGNRFAIWPGELHDGHRNSQDNENFGVGQDFYSYSDEGDIGGNSEDDEIGFGFALRDVSGTITGSIFVADLTVGGRFVQDVSAISPALPPAFAFPTDPFSVTVDIGPDLQRVQAGHVFAPIDGFAPDEGSNGDSISDIPIATGTGETFFLALNAEDVGGAILGGIDWRDRGDSVSAGSLVKMGEDFVKNNTGVVRMEFDGLPAGSYTVTAYHRDPDFAQAEEIRVYIDNNGTGLVLQDPNTWGNADLADPNAGVDGLSNAGIAETQSVFSFESFGSTTVVVLFDGTAAVDTEVPLNGFTIEYIPSPFLPADVNEDFFVNEADLILIAAEMFTANTDVDVNGDGFIDQFDYRIWQSLNGLNSVPLGAASSVPEPASLGLALLGAVALLGIGRRRI